LDKDTLGLQVQNAIRIKTLRMLETFNPFMSPV